jgi:hypothetical protein
MEKKHYNLERYPSIDEYAKYKRKYHLDYLEEKLEENKFNLEMEESETEAEAEDDNEDENSELIKQQIYEIISNRIEYENSIDKDLPITSDIFCPQYTMLERRARLIRAGIAEFDESEAAEIAEIKNSRKICGCNCNAVGLVCGPLTSLDPKTGKQICSCWENGIPCQIDASKYPCSCSIARCQNTFGKKRFNIAAVIKHCKSVLKRERNKNSDNPPEKGKKKVLIEEEEEEEGGGEDDQLVAGIKRKFNQQLQTQTKSKKKHF